MYKIYALLLFMLPTFKIDSMHLRLKSSNNKLSQYGFRFQKNNYQADACKFKEFGKTVLRNKLYPKILINADFVVKFY